MGGPERTLKVRPLSELKSLSVDPGSAGHTGTYTRAQVCSWSHGDKITKWRTGSRKAVEQDFSVAARYTSRASVT